MEFPKTLSEAAVKFADEDYALAVMTLLRWPNGVVCPVCGSDHHSFLKTRRIWKCLDCKKQFSIRLGSILEDSPLPLGKWLMIIWLCANAKNGISSYEVARATGISQKSAWFALHRVRAGLKSKSFEKLSGTIEADETFIGGKIDRRKPENRSKGRGITDKQPLLGLLQRDGEIRTFVVPNVGQQNLQPIIHEHVEKGSNLFTDKGGGYFGLGKDYRHEWVNHVDEWVRGDVHSNNIEAYWSLLKRCIKGTWIRPSKRHLFRFAADQKFRFNYRKTNDLGRFLVATYQSNGCRLTYDELVGRRKPKPDA